MKRHLRPRPQLLHEGYTLLEDADTVSEVDAAGGKLLFDEMMYNKEYAEFRAIGFTDDDPELEGQEIGGLRIRGLASWFEDKERQRVPEVWISSSKITDDAARAELARLGLDPRLRRLHISVSEVAGAAKLE